MKREQIKQLLKLSMPIILSTFLILGVSYAWFTLTLRGTKEQVLHSGTLSLVLNDATGNGISLLKEQPIYDEEGVTLTPYTFTLTNNGTVDSDYTIYLDDVTLETGEVRLPDSVIKYNLVKDDTSINTALLSTIGVSPNRVLDTGTISPGDTYSYELRLWLDENMTNADMGKTFRGKIRVEARQVIEDMPNSNILALYKYDETDAATKCVTGEESTCVKLTHSSDITYDKGTVIRYRVNASENYYFHVLYDNGDTLTLQQREDTLNSAWYSASDDSTKGPIDAIAALEEETSDWTNVLDQTYTMGSTIFGNTNAFTGCTSYKSCNTNPYEWQTKTAKARMITVQEAADHGCGTAISSCATYLHNYLSKSASNGGTVNGSNTMYWTMSAATYNSTSRGYAVSTTGVLNGNSGTTTSCGVRAVIVVNK